MYILPTDIYHRPLLHFASWWDISVDNVVALQQSDFEMAKLLWRILTFQDCLFSLQTTVLLCSLALSQLFPWSLKSLSQF